MFFLHCPKSQYTRLGKPEAKCTPWKTGRNTIASLRAMEKSGGKYAPAKGKYHINVGTQFHCVRNTHQKNTHASENRTQYNCVPTRHGKIGRKIYPTHKGNTT